MEHSILKTPILEHFLGDFRGEIEALKKVCQKRSFLVQCLKEHWFESLRHARRVIYD